ncbi:TldD/PmbA family protein [Dysgonomonas sp. Marseille-P4677]|uniref:TldD/PmbA family protein n=1 Tax=Dysgonomonas sp. Marseille-P4677 TaxID=2364790 RepID=UPI0019128736|nr:TldD/PmbA family protein [Dysgonomonas sp. Marseille-P4677]MBK5719392.1 TldD/PmbA family protein [Dysgonomonas sp. Marseille-P4677]
MITEHHKDIAQWAMKLALQNGCQSARVSIITGNNNSFEYRNTQLDKLHQSSENKLYIELFVDGRYGTFSTNRIDKNGLEAFIKEGIASTKYLSPDIFRQLPNADRYYKGNGSDLDLYDQSFDNISTDQKLYIARQAVEEIYESDERIISISSAYDDGVGAEYMIASNGFEAESYDSAFNLTVEVALKTNGDARSESYWFDSAIYWDDLKKNGIGKKALERALRKIGQTKIKSGRYDLLLDNTTSSRLFSPIISAIYGTALQQKNSFLLNKLGEKIASDKLTVTDTPHLNRAFGARWFDGEGVATKERAIIEKGVLKTYFIDTYNSLKMDVMPTIASPSIIQTAQGNKNHDELLHSIQKGIWVTGFNGGNSNSTTGDFSFGVEGFLIENGIATTPISEMNITGNILTLWENLIDVGNDPRNSSPWRLPSLLFSEVNFSGL